MWFGYTLLFAIGLTIVAAAPSEKESKDMNDKEAAEIKQIQELLKELELLDKIENSTDSRESRGLLKKLSFLAGLHAGNFIQSSGTLSASNSLRIFGKVMNSALSVSYGSADDLVGPLPHVETSEAVTEAIETDEKVPAIRGVFSEQFFTSTEDPVVIMRQQFIKNHNSHVERLNQRFLKSTFTPRESR